MSQRINRRDLLAGLAAGVIGAAIARGEGLAFLPLPLGEGRGEGLASIPAADVVQSLCDRGAFGDLTYASGGSIEHYQTIRRWMRIARYDRLATLVSRREGATRHILLRTPLSQLIELRMPLDPATTTNTLTLHGTRGACRLDAAGNWIYLHGRTRGHQWEPLGKMSNL